MAIMHSEKVDCKCGLSAADLCIGNKRAVTVQDEKTRNDPMNGEGKKSNL